MDIGATRGSPTRDVVDTEFPRRPQKVVTGRVEHETLNTLPLAARLSFG
jgi:hypothetical protein